MDKKNLQNQIEGLFSDLALPVEAVEESSLVEPALEEVFAPEPPAELEAEPATASEPEQEATPPPEPEPVPAEPGGIVVPAVAAAADAIIVTDRDGTIQFANHGFERLTGYTAAEAVGYNPRLLKSGMQSPAAYREMWTHITAGKVWRSEITNKRRDGTLYRAQISISPVRDAQGHITHFVAVQRDTEEFGSQESGRSAVLAELENRAQQLQAAAEVSRAASSILDLDDLLSQSAQLIQDGFGLYYTGIFLLDTDNRWAVLRAGTGTAGQRMMEQGHKLQVGGASMVGWCIDNRQARIALHAGEDAVRFANPLLPETRSEMALPLQSRGRIIGAMTIQSTNLDAFSENDISLLQTMADQLANAIENASLFEQGQRRITDLAVVNEASQAIALAQNLDDLLEMVHRQASRLFDTTNFFLAVYQPDNSQWGTALHIERGQRQPAAWYPVSEGITGHIIRTATPGQHLLFNTMQENIDFHLSLGRQLIGEMARSWLGVPLFSGDRIMGVMGIQSYEQENLYDEQDVNLFSALANQVAVAIDGLNLLEETRRHAEELAVLNELSQALSGTLNEDAVLREIHRGVSRLVDTSNFYIGLYLPDQHEVMFPVNVSESRIDREVIRISADQGITGHIIRNRTSVLIQDDVAGWQKQAGIAQVGQPAACWLGVPLLLGDQVLGVMAVQDYTTPYLYTEHDKDLLRAIAAQAAIAINNARLFQQAQERARREQVLREVTERMSAATNVEAVMRSAAQELGRALGRPAFVWMGDQQPEAAKEGKR